MTEVGTKCGAHDELVRRLDDRWEDFTAHQAITNREIFRKVDLISNKLNWILGGIAIGIPLIQMIFHALWKIGEK